MAVNDILLLGGLATDKHYLIQIKGKEQIAFKENEKIDLYEGIVFISQYTGEMPVSEE